MAQKKNWHPNYKPWGEGKKINGDLKKIRCKKLQDAKNGKNARNIRLDFKCENIINS